MPRRFHHVLLFAVAAIFIIGGSDKANAACVSSSGSQVIRPVFSDGASVMYCPDGDNWSTLLSAGAGVPAGSTGHVQFNNAGAFAGDAELFWDNTNKRLGIGTAAPGHKLAVETATGQATIRVRANSVGRAALILQTSADDTTKDSTIFLANTDFGSGDGFMLIWDHDVDKFHITDIGGANRVTVDTDGRVGIGTTTPSVALELGAAGELRSVDGAVQTFLQSSSGGSGGFIGTRSNHPVNIRTNNSDKIYVGTNGNVGIGTTAPTQKLSVNGRISSSVIGSYCGSSTATTGNIGGYPAAKALCETACGNANAHMCTAHEIGISAQLGISMAAGAWYSSNTLHSFVEGASSRATFDCDGWNNNSASLWGPEILNSAGRPDANLCNESHPVACCL